MKYLLTSCVASMHMESRSGKSVGDRSYYISKEFTRSHHYPVGRGTRYSTAIRCERVFLKASWGLYDTIEMVHARLHEHSVEKFSLRVMLNPTTTGHTPAASMTLSEFSLVIRFVAANTTVSFLMLLKSP
ncbi:hypothetical protein BDP27DRAFT_734199 [Rhodocollybia butyracea]|nr:hypothetical protein BDP27DRAFT_734199 [Rhodocollybia butyracea]